MSERTAGSRKPGQARYCLVFFGLLGLGLALCVWANSRIPDYRNTPVDFTRMSADERLLLDGLTREQIGALKIGFMESAAPPDIGLFGNHQIQYWSAESFREAGFQGTVFNYWYANLALPDLLDYLRFVEAREKLPRRLMVVQVTTPNNDNGSYIVDRSKELPSDIQMATDRASALLSYAVRFKLWLDRTFDYATVLIGLFHADERGRVVAAGGCGETSTSSIQRHMPAMFATVLSFAGLGDRVCDPTMFRNALRRDGSIDPTGLRSSPVRNQNPLDPQKAHLNLGDENRIADLMQAIDAVGKRNGIPVVFVIPPVYEDARYSTVDRIFDRALEQVPGLKVVDHRAAGRDRRDDFINYDHPAKPYYDRLTGMLLRDYLAAP
ncbi:MAG: hypothetical protein AB7G39_08385 [Alphaproteobacteria bacterium]